MTEWNNTINTSDVWSPEQGALSSNAALCGEVQPSVDSVPHLHEALRKRERNVSQADLVLLGESGSQPKDEGNLQEPGLHYST